MINTVIVGLLALCLCVVWLVRRSQCTNAMTLPGPWNLPVLGYIPQLCLSPHTTLTRLRSQYGDVYQLKLGSIPVVVLNGLNTIKCALDGKLSEKFAGRPALSSFLVASEGKTMCFNSYSERWRCHRRLAERALKKTANQDIIFQNVLVDEAQHLVNTWKANVQQPFDPDKDLFWSAAHVMYSLCYGRSRDDPDFKSMVSHTMNLVTMHNKGNVVNFVPCLKYVIPQAKSYLSGACVMMSLTKEKENEHLLSHEDGQIRDILDGLIQLGGHGDDSMLDRDRVLHTVQEYIGAGLDITYRAYTWVLLYIVAYPEVQSCLLREVNEVIGERQVQPADLRHMSYCEAFILEVLRHSSFVPFTLPHSTIDDVVLNGHSIPKGTFTLINLHSVNTDPQTWHEPQVFRPERFLSEDGTLDRGLMDRVVAYSLGKRRCLGEQFSKQQIKVFLAVLLQQCTVCCPDGHKGYDLEPISGVVLQTKPYQIIVRSR